MTPVRESYRKVPYDLRECKQVERRMLIDAMLRLAAAGFSISDYQYTGMGSVYFFDFMLFHKFLGIDKLLSVEISKSVEKRVEFNRPFGVVTAVIDEIGNVIPKLDRDVKHILWLDYDSNIVANYLSDVVSSLTILSPGSILLVTVDVEPPELPEAETSGPEQWQQYFAREAAGYLPETVDKATFARSNLVKLNIEVIWNAVSRGMRSRKSMEFCPLFNFVYKDGHRMLTIGGMLCAAEDKRRLMSSSVTNAVYFRRSFADDPFEIKVPRFTKREKLLLDRAMPCADEWLPKDFEAISDDIKAYRDVYRFLPNYGEMIV